MWNLNAIEIFGQVIDWPMETALFWLLVAQVALVIFMVIVFAILILRVKKNPTQVVVQSDEERALVGIELDTSLAPREFAIGEEFSCEGLLVTAHYNKDPYSEILHEITLLTPEKLEELMQDNKKIEDLEGCVVYVPKLDVEGKPTVTVAYKGKTAVYAVNVVTEHAPVAVTEEEPKERELLGISLDTAVVQREFTVGDTFNCDGLLVTANYNVEPLSEQVFEFTVFTPDMNVEGKPTVTVAFGGKTAVYAISVNAKTEEPAEHERELVGLSLDASMVRREFTVGEQFNCEGLVVTANYSEPPYSEVVTDYEVDAPDMTCEGKPTVTVRYGEKSAVYVVSVVSDVRRELLRITLDTGLVQREFTEGGRFNAEGLVVYASYSEEPYVEVVEDYAVDAPDLSAAGEAVVGVRFGGKRASYPVTVLEAERPAVRELVGITLYTDNVRKEYTAGEALDTTGLIVVANYNMEPLAEEVSDYEILPVDMTQVGAPTVLVRYGEKTIGYQIIVSPATVVINEEPEVIRVKADPIYIQEEQHPQGTLRYDRSFTARLIQSDDEVKHWYTELKNDLLSYKKVKARMSWKRESYRFGRETAVRLSYRGKTLCIYFPLDPKDYEETKYKVEPIDDSVTYEDTPCLYRIKNAKRVRYAMELIAVVMERLGAKRDENHISEDYYVPYEGIVELINKGLIKRNIKTKEDEAFFRQNADAVEEEVAPTDVEIAPGIIVTGAVLEEEKRRTLPVPETFEEPAEEAPVEETPVEETPVEEAPVEETPVEEVPVEETPVEEVPVEEVPVEETPVEEVPVEEVPVEETPVEEVPVEEPVEETPVEEVPVEETPVEEVPVEEVPVEEVPVEEAPAEGTESDGTSDDSGDEAPATRMSLSERRRKSRHKRR